ncbi:MAG: hypothetical protein ABI282_06870 [Candidatus Baltobacteraceae bacterium]
MKPICLHIGTHKTGTKALQVFLSANRNALEGAGIHLGTAGRQLLAERAFTPGHHVIAWELQQSGTSVELDKLVEELRANPSPVAVISSEEFHPLHANVATLEHLRDALRSGGYEAKIVIYLRSQARYAESLYSEYSKQSFIGTFERYVDTILQNGFYRQAPGAATIVFEYTRLLEPFERVFGAKNIVVRPYRTDQNAEFLFRDFLTILANVRGGLTLNNMQNPSPVANVSLTLIQLLERVHADLARQGAALEAPRALIAAQFPQSDEAVLNQRFQLLTFEDSLRFVERFAADNEALKDRYAVELQLIRAADIPPPESAMWETARRHREIFRGAIDHWTT